MIANVFTKPKKVKRDQKIEKNSPEITKIEKKENKINENPNQK